MDYCSRSGSFSLATVLILSLLANAHTRAAEVPKWFRHDPARPDGIYEAWKELSAPDAVLFGCCNSNVIAGVLKDRDGKPLPETPLLLRQNSYRSIGLTGRVRTDANGYFIIYSPVESELRKFYRGPVGDSGFNFYAIPGFPFSDPAYEYAAKIGALAECEFRLLAGGDGLRFYELRVKDAVPFDAADFGAFKSDLAKKIERRNKISRGLGFTSSEFPLRSGPAGPKRRRVEYILRLTSADGHPVSNAALRYRMYDGAQQDEVMKTDADGLCRVHEALQIDREAEYYEKFVQRGLLLDVPGGVSGPITVHPREGVTNRVNIPSPARLHGKLEISGAPFISGLTLSYQNHLLSHSAEEVRPLPDGSYSFERVMPGEPFVISIESLYPFTSPRGLIRMEPITLRLGEDRLLNLIIPFGSAIAGVVLDESGRAITNRLSVSLSPSIPTSVGGKGFLFFFAPLHGDYELRTMARGFLSETQRITHLQPGELRFLQVRLKANPARFAKKALREWLADLDRWGDPKEWAQERIAALGPKIIPELMAMMRSPDEKERQWAMNGFEVLGPRAAAATPELLARLAADDRAYPIKALVAIGPAAVPGLTEQLDSESAQVRQSASWGLGELRSEQALSKMILLLDDPDKIVRSNAIWALGRIGEEPGRVLPLIARFLADPIATFRSSAAFALADFGTAAKNYVPAIAKLLNDENKFVRVYATNALERIDPEFLKQRPPETK